MEETPAGRIDITAALRHALESIDDLIGRIASYAQLVYTGNTIDPVRAKFFGDVQERITASSSHLLFFSLELNQIDDPHGDPAFDQDHDGVLAD